MEDCTVKSLFAGAGGLDFGLEQAGFHVVEAYEYDTTACDTLSNVGVSDVYKCDIRKLLLEGQINTFVITATFPCTRFSTAGKRDGDELYLEAHRIIRCLQPEVFVIENVPNMARFEIVMEAFLKMPGYHVSRFMLDASELGAAQKRKRLILIGTKHPFEFSFLPAAEQDKKYLRDVVEYGIDMPLSKGILNRLHGKNTGQWSARIYDPSERDYGPTCMAHYSKDMGDQLVVDPETKKVRSFTTTEYCRLQGFPDDYPFAGGMRATYKQIGNAVSPIMAAAIGREIARYARTIEPDVTAYNRRHHTMVRKVVIA